MDSYEFNKIAGAVLFALLVVFGLSIVSDIIYTDSAGIYEEGSTENPGYVIEVAASSDDHGGDEAVEEVPFAVVLASADAGKGETVAKKCIACHTFEQGGANKVGPNLFNVVGGPVAHIEGFGYSTALAARGEAGDEWTYDSLDQFLENPKKYVEGTAMSFAGLRKIDDRANMIAYMRTLSDNPIPLPEIAVDEAKANEEATATDETLMETAATDETAKVEEEIAAAGEAANATHDAAPAATDHASAPSAEPADNATPAATSETNAASQEAPASGEAAAPSSGSAAEPTSSTDTASTSSTGSSSTAESTANTDTASATPATDSSATEASDQSQATAESTESTPTAADPAAASSDTASTDSFSDLVAKANVSDGESTFRRCKACHTIEEGGPNRVGPNLWNVVGRPVASVEGYKYSDAMKAFAEGGKVWSIAELNTYLTNPKGTVPKTKMVFPGLKDETDRADLIGYLKSQ